MQFDEKTLHGCIVNEITHNGDNNTMNMNVRRLKKLKKASEDVYKRQADTLQSSAYVTMEGGKTGEVAEFEQALTGGSNPSVTGDGYVEGFYALEPYYYNVICCDTIAEGVQNLLHEYIDEVVKVGKFPIGVACADTTAAFNERKTCLLYTS